MTNDNDLTSRCLLNACPNYNTNFLLYLIYGFSDSGCDKQLEVGELLQKNTSDCLICIHGEKVHYSSELEGKKWQVMGI